MYGVVCLETVGVGLIHNVHVISREYMEQLWSESIVSLLCGGSSSHREAL